MAFSVESLELGIEKCKVNIQTFEDAIQKERDTIQEYHGMIDTLREQNRREEDLKSRIEVES